MFVTRYDVTTYAAGTLREGYYFRKWYNNGKYKENLQFSLDLE